MLCTFCLKENQEQLNWSNIFTPTLLRGLCTGCNMKLERIEGPCCPSCSKPGSTGICIDCLSWRKLGYGGASLDGNRSIYTYNSYMKEMIYQWKYRGDYEIGFSFQQEITQAFKELEVEKGTILVPIPLSSERLAERGFNQASQLIDFIPCKNEMLLKRIHGEKQSKRTRQERIYADNPFIAEEKVEKPVILVDDIYTTGATLHKAAAVLKKAGCPCVRSLTLVRG